MSEWQPISTAPKDGSAVLVLLSEAISNNGMYWPDRADEDRRVTLAAWSKKDIGEPAGWRCAEGALEFSYGGDTHSFEYIEATRIKPTHWMPLPPPSPSQEVRINVTDQFFDALELSEVLVRARDALKPFVDCNFTYMDGRVIGTDMRMTRDLVERARSALSEVERALQGKENGNG